MTIITSGINETVSALGPDGGVVILTSALKAGS